MWHHGALPALSSCLQLPVALSRPPLGPVFNDPTLPLDRWTLIIPYHVALWLECTNTARAAWGNHLLVTASVPAVVAVVTDDEPLQQSRDLHAPRPAPRHLNPTPHLHSRLETLLNLAEMLKTAAPDLELGDAAVLARLVAPRNRTVTLCVPALLLLLPFFSKGNPLLAANRDRDGEDELVLLDARLVPYRIGDGGRALGRRAHAARAPALPAVRHRAGIVELASRSTGLRAQEAVDRLVLEVLAGVWG